MNKWRNVLLLAVFGLAACDGLQDRGIAGDNVFADPDQTDDGGNGGNGGNGGSAPVGGNGGDAGNGGAGDDSGSDNGDGMDGGTDDGGSGNGGSGNGGSDGDAALNTPQAQSASVVTSLAKLGVSLADANATAQDAGDSQPTTASLTTKQAFMVPCDAGSATGDSDFSSDFTTITTRFNYNDCRLGDAIFDGVLVSQTTFDSPPTGGTPPERFSGTNTSGEGNTPFVIEVVAPEADRTRIGQLGTVDFEFVLDGQEPDTAEFFYRETVDIVNTADPALPAVRSTLGNASMPYRTFVDFMDDEASLISEGPFETSGDCGEGSGTVSTPTPVIVDLDTGLARAGQLVINSAEGTTTATYNDDGTVTIDTPTGSQTFTPEELEALCPV